MITHKLNDFTIGFIEGNLVKGCELPKEKGYKLIGTSIDLTNEECIEFMPTFYYWGKKRYKDYVTNTYSLEFTALESYNSMKVMLGVNDVNPIPEPEFQGGLCGEDNQGGYDPKWVADFEQAQSQVKRYVVVVKKD